MLLTPHWLGFVLLAVFICPACAAPPLVRRSITYEVTVVSVHGHDIKEVPSIAHKRIMELLGVVTTQLRDGPGHKNIKHHSIAVGDTSAFNADSMFYFKLTGGNSCPVMCYGYVVPNYKGSTKIIGAVFTWDGEHQYGVVRKPMTDVQKASKDFTNTRKRWHIWFLKNFGPIKRWVVAMAQYPAASEFEGVKEAAHAIIAKEAADKVKANKADAAAKAKAEEEAKARAALQAAKAEAEAKRNRVSIKNLLNSTVSIQNLLNTP
ncbi:hypothetical protein BDP27DRAFT_1433490 [Rhodocollybia butyracea]|uniref:Uncharacterized protein n=1 Tax=Rhodocollybia butyracea TaxID=206335 RepID=A0A9P5P8D4_9AGAR|nr:hypothetical protein BDP27DRAFT_1433490 [Rhodocollybia butyracea]